MMTPFRRIAGPVIRAVYQLASRTRNEQVRTRLLRQAVAWRRLIYPPGGRVMAIAAIGDDLRAWVNMCEFEGGNRFFGLQFEPSEMAVAKRLVEAGDVFFDVGANIGLYSLLASRLVGAAGSVHAFEPAFLSYDTLVRNISFNQASNVVVNRTAVSDAPGEVGLFVNRESGLTSLGPTGRGQLIGSEKVPAISLDEYVQRHGIPRVDFLKVDVEGYEGQVLRGAANLLGRERDLVVLCELARKNFAPLNFSIDLVINWVRQRGYEVWEVTPQSSLLRVEKYPLAENQNFVFIRPGSRKHALVMEMQSPDTRKERVRS